MLLLSTISSSGDRTVQVDLADTFCFTIYRIRSDCLLSLPKVFLCLGIRTQFMYLFCFNHHSLMVLCRTSRYFCELMMYIKAMSSFLLHCYKSFVMYNYYSWMITVLMDHDYYQMEFSSILLGLSYALPH